MVEIKKVELRLSGPHPLNGILEDLEGKTTTFFFGNYRSKSSIYIYI